MARSRRAHLVIKPARPVGTTGDFRASPPGPTTLEPARPKRRLTPSSPSGDCRAGTGMRSSVVPNDRSQPVSDQVGGQFHGNMDMRMSTAPTPKWAASSNPPRRENSKSLLATAYTRRCWRVGSEYLTSTASRTSQVRLAVPVGYFEEYLGTHRDLGKLTPGFAQTLETRSRRIGTHPEVSCTPLLAV